MDKDLSFLKEGILKILDDAKVHDVSVIDIKDKSNFAELLIICTGTSNTHIKSTSVKLIDFIKQNKNSFLRGVEETNDWILIDLIDVVQPITCNSECDAILNIQASGGTLPYTYDVDGNNTGNNNICIF